MRHGDQRLRDAVGICGAVRIFGLDFSKDEVTTSRLCGSSAMRRRRLMKTVRLVVKEQIRSARSLRSTVHVSSIPSIGVIAEAQGAVFDFGEPSFESAEGERILLAGIDNCDGKWVRI